MRFSYLDGLRGMAALFVLVRHWETLFGLGFARSYLAVDLFFMLSGFVIAHAYDDRLRSGAMTAAGFMRIRLARLYPVYALAVLVCLAVNLWRAGARADPAAVLAEWCLSALAALCFVPFGVTGTTAMFPLNVCFWSLCLEMLVNLLYARTRPMLSSRVLAGAVAVAALLLASMALSTDTLSHGFLRGAASFYGGLLRAVFGIGLGMLLYRHRAGLAPLARWLPAWCSLPIVAVLLMVPEVPGYGGLLDLAGVLVVLPFAILVAAGSEPAQAWQVRTMTALGIASYPVYLLHVPFGIVARYGARMAPGWERPVAALAAVLLVWLCLRLDRHFDRPLRQWLRARLLHRPAASAADAG